MALGFGLIATDEECGSASRVGFSDDVLLLFHIIKAVFDDEDELILEGGEELFGRLTNGDSLNLFHGNFQDGIASVFSAVAEGTVPIDFLKDGIADNPRNIGLIGLVLNRRQVDDLNIGHARRFWGAAHLIVRARAESEAKQSWEEVFHGAGRLRG